MIETFKIGRLTRTHGVKGMLCMDFTDDVWDRADAVYLFLEIDGLPVPFFLDEWRFLNDCQALLKFDDIDDENEAARYIGCDVLFPAELVPDEEEDVESVTWRHFTGWTLIDSKAGNIGTIAHVDDSTPNILFETEGRLIPANEDFIERIDTKERTVYTNLPEGLLEL